jgi:hypothetical protein
MFARALVSTRSIKFLHDNAPVNKSAVVKEYLDTHGTETLPHPPYSSDLALCSVWLNAVITEHIVGRRFESRPVIGSTVFQSMNTIPQNDYKVAFSKWIVRLKSANGEYFEGLS